MNKFIITLLLSSSIILSGCASNSPESDPSYISPTFYQGYGVSSEENKELKIFQNQFDILEQTAIQKECN